MTDSKLCIDSSVWLDYFLNEDTKVKKYIDTEDYLLITSSLTIYEIRKKLMGIKLEKKKITEEEAIEDVKQSSIIVEPGEQICYKAAKDSITHGLSAIDAIIYRTAIDNNASLLTLDSDFSKLKNVIYI